MNVKRIAPLLLLTSSMLLGLGCNADEKNSGEKSEVAPSASAATAVLAADMDVDVEADVEKAATVSEGVAKPDVVTKPEEVKAKAATVKEAVAVKSPLYKEGTHYSILKEVPEYSKGDKVEVVEFFSYGCPHCYHMESTLKEWKKNKPNSISFKKIPAQWNPYYKNLAKAFYTAELLKLDESVHEKLFSMIHQQRNPLKKVSDIKNFFVKLGVTKEEFDQTFESFAMSQKLNMGDSLFRAYKLNHVPIFVVGGRYVTDVTRAGGSAEAIKVIEFLARKVKHDS